MIKSQEGDTKRFIYPRATGRAPIHSAVPDYLREDYEEGTLVLSDSPKASAALARRCLQTLLVKNGATKHNLIDQINEIAPTLPGYLQETIDHIRQIGNISAHAKEHKATGEIVDVEPGEAEWLLHVLEELFDHFYAKPAIAKQRSAAIALKLASSKKPSP